VSRRRRHGAGPEGRIAGRGRMACVALLMLVPVWPAALAEAAPRCAPAPILLPGGEPHAARPRCAGKPATTRSRPADAARLRNGGEVPLPGKRPPPAEEDDGLELSDGVSLTGRLGPRDQENVGGLDGVTTKRTAIVPRRIEEGAGTLLKHGTSDGLGLGLSFDFESR
jgi:hypothetical protein